MDVLEAEWAGVLDAARAVLDQASPSPSGEGLGVGAVGHAHRLADNPHPSAAARLLPSPAGEGLNQAIALAGAFHERLCALRILDPACGTGNFLYVAMENLLRLESEVRQFVIGLGGRLEPTIHPNQFLGLELNARAAVIAELVLWIGWLRFRLANTPDAIGEPVLPTLQNINLGLHPSKYDAVLVRTAIGEPDAETPRRPVWPEADFIVGNPPFIGGQDIRERLGGAYAEALWRANPRVPKSADFVMHWWDRAADILTRPGTRLRRFGFVTTNSITQVFSRRVIEGWLAKSSPSTCDGEVAAAPAADGGEPSRQPRPAPPSPPPPRQAAWRSPSPSQVDGEDQAGKLHLVLAIPDHPWTRATRDAAAVRIAMTVAEAGPGEGRLIEIVGEAGLDTDEPVLEERDTTGRINADLSVGTDVTRIARLKANEGICHDGVKLHGKGFSVTRKEIAALGGDVREGIAQHIRPYRNGRDLTGRTAIETSDKHVIDLFGLQEQSVMERFPELYQHVLTQVKPERDRNRRESYRRNWWIFGEPRRELRPAIAGLSSFIGTVDTAKHRLFQLIPVEVVCDDGVVVIASDDFAMLGVLSSTIHEKWVLQTGGWLGFGNDNRYNKSLVFDPFPFPDRSEAVAEIAERLDAARRAALGENAALTMTGLYNFVAAIRDNTLPAEHEPAATRARAFIVAKLHDDLDAAVAEAYGWGEDWRRAPQGTGLPPAEIVRRLVALNAQRAAEEATGHVRWLRPDYQIPRFAAVKG